MRRNLVFAVCVAVVVVLGAVDFYYSTVRYEAWTWMFTPPPRIDGTDYGRVAAPADSAELDKLQNRYGKPLDSGRRWPLPFRIEESSRRCDSEPWVLYVHGFDGKVYPYVLNAGCV